MPRPESSRKNLEAARAKLKATIEAGRAAAAKDAESDDGVYDAEAEAEPLPEAPAKKKAKLAAAPAGQHPPEGSESDESDDEQERKRQPAKKRKADAISELVKQQIAEHFKTLQSGVHAAVRHGQLDRDLNRFLMR